MREKFLDLKRLTGEGGAQFYLIHLLLPHPPFVLRSDCSSREPIWIPSEDPETWLLFREGYVEHIRCLNSLILDLVDRILAQSGESAVIVLQADHGTVRVHPDPFFRSKPMAELEPERIAERIGIFAAYLFPGKGPEAVPDSITPINVFPLILNLYFGEDIPYRDDTTFWSNYQEPYRFDRVDEHLLTGM